MFKSVFSRYITAFMLIILISFIMVSAVISAQVSEFNSNNQRDLLDRTANSVKYYIESEYVRVGAQDIGSFVSGEQNRLMREISTLAALSSDAFVFVVDRQGSFIIHSDNTMSLTSASRVPWDIMNSLQKKNGKVTGNGTLGGVFSDNYMYCARSLQIEGKTVGAVFACRSVLALKLLLSTVVKTIVMAILWILLAALIAVYFISERITRPLKQMSTAAKEFAAGRFDVRVPVMGNDEVSELAIAFNQMAESLSKQEETRRNFLANVSHDLRTPMTTIGGFIESILAGAIPPDKVNGYLEIIESEIRRLSRLVNSLLDISRIQAGERKFNPESFDICEMGRQILLSFEQKIDQKHLDVEFNCDHDNMYAYADRDAINQIFYNLCDNAVKFSRDGGKYEISITHKEGKIHVSVFNEGEGITPEDLPFVFDRFYKGDRSRGLDKTGTGLGLFIAKTIVCAHNERIWAESEHGKWCRFTFTLPTAQPPQKRETRENGRHAKGANS